MEVVEDVHLLELSAVAYLIKEVGDDHTTLLLYEVSQLCLEIADHVTVCKELLKVVHGCLSTAATTSQTTCVVFD